MVNAPQPLLRQTRAWVGAALAATLPVVLAASGPPATLAQGPARHGDAGWAGSWMGTATTGVGTTMAQIRTAIGAGTGTAATLTGAGIGIALIDTGVANVPGLPKAQIVNGPDLSFESQSPELRYQDTYGHGTHMAGIIVGNDTATGTVGIAPKAKITSIKVGVASGAVDVSQVIAAIDWTVQNRNHDPSHPIRVINLSYGTSGEASLNSDTLHFAVEKAWKAGIVVVASTGNDGLLPNPNVSNPAEDGIVIAVGATTTMGTASTSDDQMAPFTSATGRQPDLLAPGTSVLSLRDTGSNIEQSYPTAAVGETLFRGSGTSQAAAVMSASVALLLQARPSLTPDQVKQAMRGGGKAILVGPGAYTNRQVNVAGALTAAVTTAAQGPALSSGTGGLESTRGTQHVMQGAAQLNGDVSIFGPFSSSAWKTLSATQTSWNKGVWMGHRMAGDGWTGTSWASKTWGSATWAGAPWGSATSWQDPDWAGRYWAGRYWAGRYWAGRYWAGSDWATSSWD